MVDSGKLPSLGARRRLLTFGKVGKFMGKEAPLPRYREWPELLVALARGPLTAL
jgi:hypothetical protein